MKKQVSHCCREGGASHWLDGVSAATLTLKLNLVAGSLKYKIRNIGVSNNIGDSQFLSLIFKVLFISCFKWFSYAYNDVS